MNDDNEYTRGYRDRFKDGKQYAMSSIPGPPIAKVCSQCGAFDALAFGLPCPSSGCPMRMSSSLLFEGK